MMCLVLVSHPLVLSIPPSAATIKCVVRPRRKQSSPFLRGGGELLVGSHHRAAQRPRRCKNFLSLCVIFKYFYATGQVPQLIS